MPFIARGASFIADVLAVVLLAAILFVAVSGGGVYQVAGERVSLTSTANPLLLFLLIALPRWFLGRHISFLGIRRFPLHSLDSRVFAALSRIPDALSRLSSTRATKRVAILLAVAFLLRVLNAYAYYGFFAGDDVEIHEMTLGHLFGADWPVWGLRNAFYPMTFIFPVQWLGQQLGVSETASLVFLGRLVVAASATATVGLLFVHARRAYGLPVAVLSAVFLATSALHTRLASTELPRPVAALFLVLAFSLAVRGGALAAAAAGISIGIAGAMRFGEAAFIVPCVLMMALERRPWQALVCAICFGTASLGIIGLADALYWGRPFHSLFNAVDYGVVQRLSSRGYEPFHWYLTHLSEWANLAVASAAILAVWLGPWRLALWTWIPVLLLSAMSHKEARYMVPVLPFLSLAAAHVGWELLRRIREWKGREPLIFGLAVVVAASFVSDVSTYRFPRSEASVDLAREHREDWETGGVAIEQLWRVGGRLYLPDVPTVVEIVPERLVQDEYLAEFLSRRDVGWILLADRTGNQHNWDRLYRAGFIDVVEDDPFFRVFRRVPSAVSHQPPSAFAAHQRHQRPQRQRAVGCGEEEKGCG